MRTSKGGLNHDQIMKLTWRQFWVYMDTFVYLLREESDKGREENKRDDREATKDDPRVNAWRESRKAKTKEEAEAIDREMAEFKQAGSIQGQQRDISELLG